MNICGEEDIRRGGRVCGEEDIGCGKSVCGEEAVRRGGGRAEEYEQRLFFPMNNRRCARKIRLQRIGTWLPSPQRNAQPTYMQKWLPARIPVSYTGDAKSDALRQQKGWRGCTKMQENQVVGVSYLDREDF
jgi:hypothetical protein